MKINNSNYSLSQLIFNLFIIPLSLLVVLSCLRVLFLVYNFDYFKILNIGEIIFSLVHGFRFDISIIIKIYGILLIIEYLFNFLRNFYVIKILNYIIAVRLTFTIFLQPIDIRYNNQLISFRDSKF
jgi:hypothetical protein